MTPEEQNIAIAEALGWTNVRMQYSGPDVGIVGRLEGQWAGRPVPAYRSDLNACADFEATLTDHERHEMYPHVLQQVYVKDWNTKETNPLYATAPQRCEAFLRTRGIWRDEP